MNRTDTHPYRSGVPFVADPRATRNRRYNRLLGTLVMVAVLAGLTEVGLAVADGLATSRAFDTCTASAVATVLAVTPEQEAAQPGSYTDRLLAADLQQPVCARLDDEHQSAVLDRARLALVRSQAHL